MSGPRNRYLLAYDVSDDKRLKKVHKAMMGLGDPLQYSVFLCDLSREELHVALERVKALIDASKDRVAVADLGPLDHKGNLRRGLRFLGVKPALRGREAIIV